MKLSLFQIVILAVFGALAVAGVIIFAFVVGGTEGQTIGDIEMWGTLDEVGVITAIRELSDKDSRYKRVVYVEKKAETYPQELIDALATGKGPDIFLMQQDETLRDQEKVIQIPLESLPAEQFRSTFVDSATPFLGQKGVIAVPLLIDPLILYWNKDMLATAGFAKPPETWNELYDMSVKITKRDNANSLQRSTIAFGEYRNVTHAKDIISLLILQAGGSITRYIGNALVPALASQSGQVSQPTESALRFYSEFANPTNQYYTWNRAQKESRAAFAAGTLALYIGKASEEPFLRQANPNLNFAAAPVPQIKSREFSTNVGTVYGMAIARTTDNTQGALTVAFLLASADSARLISRAVGLPAARRDVVSETRSGVDDLFNKQAIIAKSWVDPNPEKTDEVFRAMIEGITSGSAKLSEAVQRAEESMATFIEKP